MNKFLPNLPIIIVLTILVSCGLLWSTGNLIVSENKIEIQKSSNDSLEDFYNTSQEIAKNNEQSNATFLAMGDIMLSRNVAGQIAKNGKDGNYPFRKLSEELASTDFNFGNLESPFSGDDSFNPTGSLVFNAPTWTLPGLINANFKVLNLANNHGFDQGLKGLLYTKKLLEEQSSIATLGVGNNLDEAWEGKVHSVRGVRIGFIGASYATLNDGGVATNNNVARIEDTKRLVESINDLKTRSDFIVVTMHAGTEYTRSPNNAQTEFAHSAIDAGADMVIGAHPHWIQTFETYKGKQIFYSLGNFIFDQEWSQDTKEGLMLKISLKKDGACATNAIAFGAACGSDVQGNPTPATLKQIELIPVIIENYSTPRLATEIEKQNILKKIGATTNVITP